MNIIGENQQTGNPIFNVGEYKDVLQIEQTLNYENISNYVKAALNKGDNEELDAAIENIFRQPIMAEVYRRNGLKPEFVDEYIASRRQQPAGAKTSMMLHLDAIYNDAANSMEEEFDMPRISGNREWLSLEVKLTSSISATMPIKMFMEQKAAENQQPKQPQKPNLLQMLKIKKGGRKL